LLAGLAVAAGAFGAHGLERLLTQGRPHAELTANQPDDINRRLANYESAVRYHTYHALALVLVGLTGTWRRSRLLDAAGWAFIVGVAGFSGGLYAIVFGAPTRLGATIVPFGGTTFIIGWFVLALAAWKVPRTA
jgi:uncharacterized membrane protein YgdD (TMEM256/DUF423 family)